MNLLITGAWTDAREYFSSIEKMGHSIVFMQMEKDALPCEPEWVEGVICNGLFVHHNIENFVNLKYIQLTSAGFDRVPMEYSIRNDISVHNAGGVYSIPMAEFAISVAMYFYKNIPFFAENQKKCLWKKNRNIIELFGKTVCIVGCGSVGTECAKRFDAFGCKVFGVDKFKTQCECFECIYPIEEMYAALAIADIAVLSVPLNDETYHIINRDALAAMKDGAILINISRGAIVDSAALISELECKRMYAALDVFESEPILESDQLWKMENVFITPHNSFVGDGNQLRLWDVIRTNLEKK